MAGKQPTSLSTSWLDDENLEIIKKTIADLDRAYQSHAIFKITLIGGGTGAAGLKYFLYTIPSIPALADKVYLNKAIFFDPVAHTKYYYHGDLAVLKSAPQILTEDSVVEEMFALNNNNRSLIVVPYEKTGNSAWLNQKRFPGRHSQIVENTNKRKGNLRVLEDV